MSDIERNTFRSLCQCCGRTIKGNENKYTVSFRVYQVRWIYGSSAQEGNRYSICKGCRRSLELFIKKGGMMT